MTDVGNELGPWWYPEAGILMMNGQVSVKVLVV